MKRKEPPDPGTTGDTKRVRASTPVDDEMEEEGRASGTFTNTVDMRVRVCLGVYLLVSIAAGAVQPHSACSSRCLLRWDNRLHLSAYLCSPESERDRADLSSDYSRKDSEGSVPVRRPTKLDSEGEEEEETSEKEEEEESEKSSDKLSFVKASSQMSQSSKWRDTGSP